MSELFMIVRQDRSGQQALRAEHRSAHLDWLSTSALPVRMAGPMLDPATGEPCGSVVFVEARSLAVLRIWASEDPFAKVGLFESTDIRSFRPSIGGFAES